MNILFLEDRGSTSYNVRIWLDNNGYNVLSAYNINDAQSIWNNRRQVHVHCIFLDLQVPMDGLTDKQRERAEGGTLAGWVWLQDNVLKDSPDMKQSTIVYSDYISVLQERIPEELYRDMKVISKRQRGSSSDVVIARIKEIAKYYQSENSSH